MNFFSFPLFPVQLLSLSGNCNSVFQIAPDLVKQGATALFHGEPGTGKTSAAEAIGFEVGRPLKVIFLFI